MTGTAGTVSWFKQANTDNAIYNMVKGQCKTGYYSKGFCSLELRDRS